MLKVNEDCQEHNGTMVTWKDMEVHLAEGLTADRQELAFVEAERQRFGDVLHQLVAIIQSLVERNLALRASTDTLNKADSGNFLKEVAVMAKFDLVMKQHVSRVESGAGNHYFIWEKIYKMNWDSISSK